MALEQNLFDQLLEAFDRGALEQAEPEVAIKWAAQAFPSKVALASSLGLEDQVLTHMIITNGLPIDIFTLDTGRLFQETYDLIERTEERYGKPIRILFPNTEDVEQMVDCHGPNLFRKSVELRRQCCHVRKIVPLKRALANLDAWICGLRRDQSMTREGLDIVQWDSLNRLAKISPLANWTEQQVWDYIRANDIPYNVLHDQGFPSIGCACCTRAIAEGEDIRAGRWWWEKPEHKECGLHSRGKQ